MEEQKKPGIFKQAIAEAQELSGAKRVENDGFVLHEYPDYETYKAVQTAGNKAKLTKQFVKKSHIRALTNYVKDTYGLITFGLCHGTRGGKEQAWFNEFFKGNGQVIGTEISDTADQFENTVQWDFHDTNPEWTAKADFVYSNSWDHAFDPVKAFGSWIDSLKPGGLMILDYTRGQTPQEANALDPFGTTFEALEKMITDNFSDSGTILDAIDRRDDDRYKALVLVFKKSA